MGFGDCMGKILEKDCGWEEQRFIIFNLERVSAGSLKIKCIGK